MTNQPEELCAECGKERYVAKHYWSYGVEWHPFRPASPAKEEMMPFLPDKDSLEQPSQLTYMPSITTPNLPAAPSQPPVPSELCTCGHSINVHDDGRLSCTFMPNNSLMCSCREFCPVPSLPAEPQPVPEPPIWWNCPKCHASGNTNLVGEFCPYGCGCKLHKQAAQPLTEVRVEEWIQSASLAVFDRIADYLQAGEGATLGAYEIGLIISRHYAARGEKP